MYEGLLFVNGNVEVIDAARTRTYMKKFMPALNFKCDETAMNAMSDFGPYDSPKLDNAPWYNPSSPESGNFFGFFPSKVEGGSDSAFSQSSTELISDGAVFGVARRKSLETRWTVVGMGKSEEAMEIGMTWLRKVLETSPAVGSVDGQCAQMSMHTLLAAPKKTTDIERLFRDHYNVSTSVAPTVTVKTHSPSGFAWHVTFTLKAGNPTAFTIAKWSTFTGMGADFSMHTDPAGQNCSAQNASYKNFINDPFYTAISTPPQPPTIKPPNLLPITTWRRKVINIPSQYSSKGNTPSVRIQVTSGADTLRQFRIRFYDAAGSITSCPSIGEYYISYLPDNAMMTIDSARKEISVRLANGVVTNGSHLLFGSAGNPFSWPEFTDEGKSYSVVCDLMPPSTNVNYDVTVYVSVSLKEN